MKGSRFIMACGFMILTHIFSQCSIAQTIKQADGLGAGALGIKDDMKSYSIICKERGKEYGDYYRAVREKIVKRLEYNYAGYYRDGDVDLFFVLNSNGSLGRIDVDLDKSTKDDRLIDMALLSLRQASPFAPFPKELDVAELPFSITVTFKEKGD